MQEQESSISPIGNDQTHTRNNLVVGAQTTDPSIRHVLDGKGTIRLFHCDNHGLPTSLVIYRCQRWRLGIGSSGYYWRIVSCLFFFDRGTIEEVLHLLCHPSCDKPSQSFLIEFFLVHGYSIFQPFLNFEEYFDEDEIRSSATSSGEAL